MEGTAQTSRPLCHFSEHAGTADRTGKTTHRNTHHSIISNSELCLIGFLADTATYKLYSIDERTALLDAIHQGAEAGSEADTVAPGNDSSPESPINYSGETP
ncbi:MAG: hypothetical protein ACI9ZF_002952 [Bradyrhizobium sp.]|jgi:hypothetical protein